MSGVHTHTLTVHGHSPIHRLPPQVKIAALVVFVAAVVFTPGHQMWAFAVHLLLVTAVIVQAELPFRHVFARAAIEIPFVLFAVFLPFVGGGARVTVAGASLSVAGLWAAWNIVAKGTLGVMASVILVSTTETPHILRGLGRLRVPATMVSIAGFMVRYLEVIGAELRRMRVAMSARGYDPVWLGQVPVWSVQVPESQQPAERLEPEPTGQRKPVVVPRQEPHRLYRESSLRAAAWGSRPGKAPPRPAPRCGIVRPVRRKAGPS